MKLTPALLLLAAAAPAFSQTAKPVVRHTTASSAAKPAVKSETKADACETGPVLPASVPKVAGCDKPLYALRYIDTVGGTGDALTPRKYLTVNYTGYLTDGTKFDSSIGKEPITFPYGAHQVITGWDTGFEGMRIGGKRRLFIPYQLAYGEPGRPPVIPAKAELVFDVELLGISETPPAPKTPPAPATPPPAAPAKPATDAPSTPDNTVGKPTTSATPDLTKPAPTDPTKPTAVPPKN